MKRFTRFCAISAMALVVSLPVAAQTYVGSYVLGNGPDWMTNPPVYSGQEAEALLFGGNASDYLISTNSNTTDPGSITRTAWYDGWGIECAEHEQTYKVDDGAPGYNDPSGEATAVSAYVKDHSCGASLTNYVWRAAPAGVVNPVPTLQEWALLSTMLMLAGVAGVMLRRRS